MNRDAHPARTSQQALIHRHIMEYPEWQKGSYGVLTRGGLIDLTLAYFPTRSFHHTSSPDLCRTLGVGFLCGYVLTRKNSNHCMAIIDWDDETMRVMNPFPNQGYQELSWDDLKTNHDADFLIFQPYS